MPEQSNLAMLDRESLEGAIAQSGEGVVITDVEGAIRYVNPAYAKLTGYRDEEVIGKKPSLFGSGVQNEAFYRDLWDTIRAGKVWSGELTNRCKDGTHYFEEMTITPLRGPDGAISGYIAHKRDVTGRRSANARILAAATAEASNAAIVSASPAGVILSWNRGAERLYGYRAEDAVGRSLAMLIARDELFALDDVNRILAQGQPVDQAEGIGLRNDGAMVAPSTTACPLRDAEGGITSAAAIIRGTSAPKSVESAESLLAAIVQGSDDAIIGTRLDGEILSWNRAAQLAYGYEAREVVGKNISILVPPDRLHERHGILERIAGGGRVTHLETVRLAKDGTQVEVSLTVSPVTDGAGKVIACSSIARDMCERKRMLESLQQSEERFRSAFETSPRGMFLSALDGRFLRVNSAFCTLLPELCTTRDAVVFS